MLMVVVGELVQLVEIEELMVELVEEIFGDLGWQHRGFDFLRS